MAEAIEFHQLTKRFANKLAVDSVSFAVKKGEAFGFLGPNGAGKTTTIRCLMDFICPTSGSVRVFGHDTHSDSVALKGRIGYLPADHHLNEKWSGREHIEFVTQLKGPSSLADELSQTLHFDPSMRVKNLSTGNKQKLALILALLGKPDLLILDEPTQGLDPMLQNEIYHVLQEFREGGGTIFMSSHNMAEVERICSRVGFIREGRVSAEDTLEEIRAKRGHIISATFKRGGAKLKLTGFGAKVLSQTATSLSVRVEGDLNPIVHELAKLQLSNLEVTHDSLEEILLGFYE